MKIIEGKYNYAIVYTDNVEKTAEEQIKILCDQEFVRGSKIRIMPDVHAGAGCTIGTTMTIDDKVVPNLVGVDIGCGIEVAALNNDSIDLRKLDALIYSGIPSGFKIRSKPHRLNDDINLNALKCAGKMNLKRAHLSIGTLGGGNHFIEICKDKQGKLYLCVHSGSRNLGHQAATYYQREAFRLLKKEGKATMPRDLAYLEGSMFEDYLHDMKLIQTYAVLNRKAIVDEIVEGMNLKVESHFTTIHNYIDTDTMILRKGAVSALQGEKLIIPINMRDGSLICLGKGNAEWNYSAPHGAGRVMSRTKAKASLSMDTFKESMKGIYTTSVNKDTLDECALAYKPMDELLKHIGDTVEVLDHIKPIYNFKAAE
ncbi:MAG: RtcB family protein [Clostridiales bacterium]|nr:RtcB family protein [Clostridiales bacterium]